MNNEDKTIKEEYKSGIDYYEEVEKHKCCSKCKEGNCSKDKNKSLENKKYK